MPGPSSRIVPQVEPIRAGIAVSSSSFARVGPVEFG